jgi:CRP/FNR family transcriptional regulator, cyclic AMP receptor protein
MASTDRVRLLDGKLELARHLGPEERAELAAATLPAIELPQGPIELDVLLRTNDAFAAGVLDGMLVHALQIGEQSGIQLLGPGDLLIQNLAASPPWLDRVEFRSVGPTRLALLGDGFLAMARRAPQVISALYECVAEQMHRATGQLVICQLPRVDQRVLALLWLLAESWGQVTPGGVRLPLALTHETLGSMIGARRPTVSLALRKLSEEGSIVHQGSGWLLLEPPPGNAARERLSPPVGRLDDDLLARGPPRQSVPDLLT